MINNMYSVYETLREFEIYLNLFYQAEFLLFRDSWRFIQILKSYFTTDIYNVFISADCF